MSREQSPLNKPPRAGNGGMANPLSSRRNRLRNSRAWRLLWLAVVWLVLPGCSLIGGPRCGSSCRVPGFMDAAGQRTETKEKKSLFGSWFGRSEPRPVQSIDEFMGLERLEP
jgi:hypothetical protein